MLSEAETHHQWVGKWCAVSAFVFYGVFHPCSLESRFLQPDYCWNRFARVSSSIKNSACFCYCINRKEMSCHESKISFFEYVQ